MKRTWAPGGEPLREVDEELHHHLERLAEELEREGWEPEAARAEARRRFGDVEFTRSFCAEQTARRRERREWTMRLDEPRQDLGYALRTLWRSPAYTAVVVATLALGIAANVTIFSVMNPYLLRPLPYADAERLVQIGHVDRESGWEMARFSLPQEVDLEAATPAFQALSSYHYGTYNLADGGVPERVQAAVLGGDMFRVLGVEAAVGRTFGPGDAGPAGADVVVLGDRIWRARYAADPGVVGSTIRLDGTPHTVVGVMGPEFNFPFNGIRMWVPERREPAAVDRERQYDLLVGRLAPGWTPERARVALNEAQARLARLHPEVDGRWDGIAVQGLRRALSFAWEPIRVGFSVLLGAVGFVLLLVCVNVASLTLARGSARRREVAVRASVGAGRGRIVRQLFTESLLLALLGGALGVAMAYAAVAAVGSVIPEDLYRVGEATIDGTVLLFTLALTLVTPLVFGLLPAASAARGDLTAGLREGTAGSGQSAGTLRARRVLVVAEVALALVLVAGAGLMLRSLARVQGLDLGLDPDRVLTVEVTPSESDYEGTEEVGEYYAAAVAAVGSLPGVEAVGTVTWLPMNHETPQVRVARPGDAGLPREDRQGAIYNAAGPGFFEAMGIEVLAGRGFTAVDGPGGARAVVLSRSLAESLFPGGTAVGRTVVTGDTPDESSEAVVVGVVEDVQHGERLGDRGPLLYASESQRGSRRRFLVVAAAGRPADLTAPVREALLGVDHDLPLGIRPMTDVVAESTVPFTLGTTLLGAFGVLALVLAALGVYGVMSYSVAARRRELGIRQALGASPAQVRGLVVGEGLGLAAVGIVVGVALALGVGRAASAMLFGVSPADPVTLGLVVLLFGAVALAASVVPALRHSGDGTEVLRAE